MRERGKIVDIYFGKRRIELQVKKAGVLGFMFRPRETENLVFDFGKPVRVGFTGFCVFFKFLILFLDSENKIVDFKVVKPFELSVNSKRNFVKAVEIPWNGRNGAIIESLVDKQRFK
jgi:uncharacterized membrane protein (UPF0127 family)